MTDDVKHQAAQRFSRFSDADRFNWRQPDPNPDAAVEAFPGDSWRIIEEAQIRPNGAVLEMPRPPQTIHAAPQPSSRVEPMQAPAAAPVSPPVRRATKRLRPAWPAAGAFHQKLLRRFMRAKPAETAQKAPETRSKAPQSQAFAARGIAAAMRAVTPKPRVPVPLPSPVEPQVPAVTGDAMAAKPSRIDGLKQKAKLAVLISARTIRHHTRREELQRKYLRSLIFMHGKVFDRKIEPLFFRPTAAPPGNQLVVANAPLTYEGPVPRLVFDWAMSALPADLKGFTFVDFRAQRGRAILLASQRNFDKIIGYEYDDTAFDDLQMNVAQFPRSPMVCRDIEVLRGDRHGLAIPPQPCVLYFSNAYREKYLSFVMDHAAAAYRASPRRMYVILENTRQTITLGHEDIFYKMPLPLKERVMSRVFSPIMMNVYRTVV